MTLSMTSINFSTKDLTKLESGDVGLNIYYLTMTC